VRLLSCLAGIVRAIGFGVRAVGERQILGEITISDNVTKSANGSDGRSGISSSQPPFPHRALTAYSRSSCGTLVNSSA
jgi:hypothetical protein